MSMREAMTNDAKALDEAVEVLHAHKPGLRSVIGALEDLARQLRAAAAVPEPEPESPFTEVLGKDATACCLAHRRTVRWLPNPMWWVHSDNRTCEPLLDYGHPLVFVRKEAS